MADYGLVGDLNSTELPQKPEDERAEALTELRKKAKYSRSKEFAELRAKAEVKIAYYRTFLPGGVPISAITEEERGKYWLVADIVIKDFLELFGEYEAANEQVKEIDNG